MILYTVGYRDAYADKRLAPGEFYSSLPPEGVTIDIRSHLYSPFLSQRKISLSNLESVPECGEHPPDQEPLRVLASPLLPEIEVLPARP